MSDELKFGMDKAPSLLKWLTDLDNNPKSHTESWCDGWNAATNNLAQENADLTAKLKLAIEALEHYADQDRWVCDEMSEHYPSGRTLYAPDHDATPAFGYTAAADALAKVGEQR